MFFVNLQYDEINISSVEMEDLKEIQEWSSTQEALINNNERNLAISEFYERFLEYYVSESEFFLKINKQNKLIGIFKGRIEFKNPNTVWISCFIMDSLYLKTEDAILVLDKIVEYFSNSYGILNFLTGLSCEDKAMLNIWKSNGFKLVRVSNDFFVENGESSNAIILKKELSAK